MIGRCVKTNTFVKRKRRPERPPLPLRTVSGGLLCSAAPHETQPREAQSQQCHARRLGNLNRYGVEEQESGILTEIEGDRLGGSDRPVDGAEDLIRAGGRVGQVRERLTVDRCRKAAWRAAIRLERERNRVK